MILIPLQNIPNQTVNINLNEQNTFIHLYYTTTGLYIDLRINDSAIFDGIKCRDRTGLKLYKYLGFNGQLIFIDTAGNLDPLPDGLGSRWHLYYLTESETAANLDGLLYV